MGERSGLGFVDVAILEALDALGAHHDRPHCKSAKVVAAVGDAIGLGPRYAYDMLVELVRDDIVNAVLVDGHGNFGTVDDPPANERYTEARLSRAGELALAAEQGGPPVPVGLVNGDFHVGGTRPPFEPHRLIEALVRICDDPATSDDQIVSMVGPPSFPTGCAVAGDVAALAAGRPVDLELQARIRGNGHDF